MSLRCSLNCDKFPLPPPPPPPVRIEGHSPTFPEICYHQEVTPTHTLVYMCIIYYLLIFYLWHSGIGTLGMVGGGGGYIHIFVVVKNVFFFFKQFLNRLETLKFVIPSKCFNTLETMWLQLSTVTV